MNQYYNKQYEQRVFEAVKNNFDELNEFFEGNAKLQFVKRIKELTGLGLKESKEFTDYFFDIPHTFNSLNTIEQRKKKLKNIYRITLLKSFIKEFKDIDEDELFNAFLKLPHDTLDILLIELGYGDNEL
jgi:hypothetical protein